MSSYYDDASLMLLASGGAQKDGKVYSVKPTDGSGDFTFTRGSNLSATRVDASQLIEKGRENLVKYSQDFSNANWSTNQSATISHGITDPNGGSTASQITFAANVNSGIYQQNSTLFASGNIRTASLYMKGSVGGEIVMFGDATNRTSVTLTTSWVRYQGFAIDTSTYFVLYTNTFSPSADTIDIAFAQYENGLVATPYIETGATSAQAGILENTPRFDYSGGATCPALLLEPQRTNVIPQSEYIASWNLVNTIATSNDAISPEGVKNATKIVTSQLGMDLKLTSISVLANTTYTYTFYIKLESGTGLQGRFYDNSNGSNIEYYNYDSQLVVGEWKRVERTFTTPVGCTNIQVWLLAASSTLVTAHYFGAQLEVGSYPTSYIPTYGVSQTRARDEAYKTGVSSLIGQTEGTLFVDFDLPRLDGFSGIIDINTALTTSATRVLLWETGGTSLSANFGQQAPSLTLNNPTIGRHKVVIIYSASICKLFVDGVKIGESSTTGSFSGLDVVSYVCAGGSVNFQQKNIHQTLLFPTALSDLDAEILTGATTYNTFAEMALALNYTVYE